MKIVDCNPFLRAAEIQPAVLEGKSLRMAYDYRLFYILEGEGLLVLKHSEHPVTPESLLFLPPKTEYHFKGRLKVIVLNFDLTRACSHRAEPICPPPVIEFDERLTFDKTVLDEEIECVTRSGAVKNDLLEIVHAFRKNDPFADAYTSGLLKKIIAELIGLGVAEERATERLVDRIRRYVKLYCSEIEDNGQIARAFGYHPVYLASLFKERTGTTLHALILTERVELACKWLEKTDRSIDEIADNTGFSSRNHFCTVFKRLTGFSPLAYRKRSRS